MLLPCRGFSIGAVWRHCAPRRHGIENCSEQVNFRGSSTSFDLVQCRTAQFAPISELEVLDYPGIYKSQVRDRVRRQGMETYVRQLERDMEYHVFD